MKWLQLLAVVIGVNLCAIEIDVIIPCVEKDLPTLEHAIAGIRKNCRAVRRVIVVSPQRLTESAEWFAEDRYPFSKRSLEQRMVGVPENFHRTGWYFQQLLKLYAFDVIPDLTDHILVLDADTVFYRDVTFVREDGVSLFATAFEWYPPYFEHIARLLPGMKPPSIRRSGIVNHMVFERERIADLMERVQAHHKRPFWQAFIDCIDPSEYGKSGASEYELYHNFSWKYYHEKTAYRRLRWCSRRSLKGVSPSTKTVFDFCTYHSWVR